MKTLLLPKRRAGEWVLDIFLRLLIGIFCFGFTCGRWLESGKFGANSTANFHSTKSSQPRAIDSNFLSHFFFPTFCVPQIPAGSLRFPHIFTFSNSPRRISKQIAHWRSSRRQFSRSAILWVLAPRNSTRKRNLRWNCTRNSARKSTSRRWRSSWTRYQRWTRARLNLAVSLSRFCWKTGKLKFWKLFAPLDPFTFVVVPFRPANREVNGEFCCLLLSWTSPQFSLCLLSFHA